ncbi:hypothetical protein P152DRAFT_476750 [Eremomyces bilateralis CBS 781.70]|uniref:AA9 family lytic polysaccharide monooxygenase n=1 Tax=Eremomyces bilateralis CBS 781.70 TaxID=1392243 RepID=A0A6G1FTW1_9PEZI|nr:uncharacterized protein P152DRAFT_476750 [Eremomyces bilateralis CBS 781.70]KAF1809193.1 hypothetical protein P152DRAFT_476750 [Eremomyces bilateralis CBS 781.70]
MNNDLETSMQRSWADEPITDPNSRYLPCNNPGGSQYESTIVEGGEEITAHFNAPPWADKSGFITVWMTECGGRTACATFRPTRAKWFKVAESGLLTGTVAKGGWAPGALAERNNSFISTIPAGMPDGGYLIRHEVVILGNSNGAGPQFYPYCGQLAYMSRNYSEAGIAPDHVRVSLPGLYEQNGSSLSIDIASGDQSVFKIPGPAPWKPGDTPVNTTETRARFRQSAYTEADHEIDENAHTLRVYK